MPINNPSQYDVDNMEQGDIVYVNKPKLLYRIYRRLFTDKPKIKVKKYWAEYSNESAMCYQEDCTLVFFYEMACVQTYKNEVPIIIGKNTEYNANASETLKVLQVGLYNVIMTFKNNQTITIPVKYFDDAIKQNANLLKQINDRRKIDELLKFQRYKGDYFQKYVKENHLKSFVPAYCSICGKPITFMFKDKEVKVKSYCDCGEIKLEKEKLSYDELSIWYYNQLNPNIKRKCDEFWFKKRESN